MVKHRTLRILPFGILILIHISVLLYTFYKHKNRRTLFVLLLTNIGFAYLFEFFVFNLFKSYKYKPRIFKKRYLDNVLGAFLSQGIYLPISSVFISSFAYGWRVKASITLFYAITEIVFIKLKIFKKNWWKTSYTVMFIPLYFYISDLWYRLLKIGNKRIFDLSYFIVSWVTGLSILNIVSVIRKKRFGIGHVRTWREHFILAPLYWFFLTLSTVLSLRNSNQLYGKLQAFLIMKVVDWFLLKKRMMDVNKSNGYIHPLFQVIMIFLMDKYKNIIKKEQYKNLRS
jgi:hypothetical protein